MMLIIFESTICGNKKPGEKLPGLTYTKDYFIPSKFLL